MVENAERESCIRTTQSMAARESCFVNDENSLKGRKCGKTMQKGNHASSTIKTQWWRMRKGNHASLMITNYPNA